MKFKVKKSILILMMIIILGVLAAIILPRKINFGEIKNTVEAYRIGSNLPYSIITTSENSVGTNLWMPSVAAYPSYSAIDARAYCIEPGARSGAGAMFNANPSTEIVYTQDDCWNGYEAYNHPYYYRNHPNFYDMGFIASYTSYYDWNGTSEEWSKAIQNAVWRSPVCKVSSVSKKNATSINAGDVVYNESKWYQTFYEKVISNTTTTNNNGDVKTNPSDATVADNVHVCVDTTTGKKMIGPFKVNYVDQTNDNKIVKFDGISNMYLVDSNGSRIEISKIKTQNMHYYYAEEHNTSAADYQTYKYYKDSYIYGEDGNHWPYSDPLNPNRKTFEQYAKENGLVKKWKNYGTPHYYEYNQNTEYTTNNNYEDYWDFTKFYPESGEEFYVEYDGNTEITGSVKLHVDVAWLQCSGEFVTRRGTWDGSESQDVVFLMNGKRRNVVESIESKVTVDVTMYTGGNVFEDLKQAKESLANGTMDASDPKISNATVTLLEKNGNSYEKAKCFTYLSTKVAMWPISQEDIDFFFINLYTPSAEQIEDYKYDTAKSISFAEYFLSHVNDTYSRTITYADGTSVTYTRDYRELKQNVRSYIEEAKKQEDYSRRINPTLTDSNGHYEFRGLDTNKKYIIQFTYNGQTYIPTDYLTTNANQANPTRYTSALAMANAGQYSTGTENAAWQTTSKGTEISNDRKNYDAKFEEIASSPHNYVSGNSLRLLDEKGYPYLPADNGIYYNETFTEMELLGCKLTEVTAGRYEYVKDDNEVQLIDGNVPRWDSTQNKVISTYSEGAITKAIKEIINNSQYLEYPTNDQVTEIYYNIIKNNKGTKIAKKLQFIEDCKISSYTQNNAGQPDEYPLFSKFVTGEQNVTINEGSNATVSIYTSGYNGTTMSEETFKNSGMTQETTYHAIYKGQAEINQGLWRRQEADAALVKDVYRATVKVNGKTEVYKYNKREEENKEYWDIQVRMSDYGSYYGSNYTRELYKSDYNVVSNDEISNKLDVYVTYKITVRNQSSLLMEIPEVVDYFSQDYKYRDDLSWITYSTTVDDANYYNMMSEQADLRGNNGNASTKITNYNATKSTLGTSRYGANTQEDIEKGSNGYDSVYVKGLEDKKLKSGESGYIYLTFEVKNNGATNVDPIIVEKDEANIAEINGYKTYYADNTKLPNNINKSSADIAGRIDKDSNPGNLTMNDVKNEKNYEDDADRAKTIKLTVTNDTRSINGIAWDDNRDTESSNAEIGNGYYKGALDKKIAGVTVALYEVNATGAATREYPTLVYNTITQRWERAITKTDSEGKYEFSGYIPGNYIVRFVYGGDIQNYKKGNEAIYQNKYTNNPYSTVLTNDSNNETNKVLEATGVNGISYNGQDYKTTTYQNGIDNGASSYNDTNSCKYIYDIAKADNAGQQVSDAKDIKGTINEKGTRTYVENYSANNVTNSIAEVLASPKSVPNYNGTEYTKADMKTLIDTLIENTYMVAETGIISAECEYNRNIITDGYNTASNDANKYKYGNDYNGKYELKNVDLGLQERPKAQLKTTKQVVNAKVTLADGSILFDATQKATNAVWIGHTAHGQDGANTYSTTDNYTTNLMKEPAVRKAANKGKIQLTMDSELMHGATIKVTYAIFIANIGEVDYKDDKFYYTGEKSNNATVVTTTPNQLVDYVGYQSDDSSKATRNNLKFDASENKDWKVITTDELTGNNNLVNSKLAGNINKYNVVITNEAISKPLIPIRINETAAKTISDKLKTDPLNAVDTANSTDSVSATKLILSQEMSSENKDDDMTYNNMVEIVKTSNTVGRRMGYSVVGNQDPLTEPNEIDSDDAQEVLVLPPFGQSHYATYYIIGTGIAIILIGGIVFIKKRVLKKKE